MLICCLLLRCQADGSLLWVVGVKTEAYYLDDPACHSCRRHIGINEILLRAVKLSLLFEILLAASLEPANIVL